MCGIAGFAGYGGSGTRELAYRMLTRIAHRGPDDNGCFVSPDQKTAIGMTRLAIIDVAQGNQPITTSDGALTIVYNGEIYNHLEVRQKLQELGCFFYTQCDTEVILLGYQVWGADCLKQLRGMFSCAIYDHRDGSIFLARDRMGIKPLYYAIKNDVLVFSSEIKSILEHPSISRTVNPNAVDNYLSLRYVPGPESLFQDIKKFPPAHFMIWKNGYVTFKRYWSHDDVCKWTGSATQAQENFDDLFDEVTRTHMVSERPVGAFLSGGLDSTAIVTSLSKQFPQGLNTFSVGFGWEGDETSIAAQTAQNLGCNHHEIVCSAQDTKSFGNIVYALDEPLGDGIVLPMYLLSKLASETVKVVQSGEGADEILGGYFMHRVMKWASVYSRYIPSIIQKGIIAPSVQAMPSSILNFAFDYPGDLGEAGKQRLIEFLHVLGNNSTRAQYRFVISLFTEKEKNYFYTKDFLSQISIHHKENEDKAILDFNKMLALQFNDWLPDDILCKLDKLSMAHSIEGRVPFMDHKLVEFVNSLQESYKLGLSGNKMILRRYLAKNQNIAMSKRKKVPFYIPIDQYLTAEPLKGMVDELLSENSVKRRGIFRPDAIKDLRKAAGQPGFLFGKQIFSLAMLELWYRIFIDKETGWVS